MLALFLPWLAGACFCFPDQDGAPSPTTADTADATSCVSLHAARIALEHGLEHCHEPLPAIDPKSWAVRATLPAPHPCDGLSPNDCAEHFVANPEDLLRPVKAGGQMRHVFLDTDARCSDGTPPLAYYRPARAGSDQDHWLFFFHGTNLGCRDSVDRLTGTLTPLGETCWSQYGPREGLHTPVGAPTEIRKGGILNPLLPGNPFADWNVVHLLQCSNDLSSGDVTVPTHLTGRADQAFDYDAPVHAHGARIVRDLFAHFAGPERPVADRNLADADQIVLAANSGGGLYLSTHLDRVAAEVTAVAPVASVEGIVDAYAPPSTMVLEAGFDGGTRCLSLFEADCDPADFDVPNEGVDPETGLGFDDSAYLPYDPVIPKGTYAGGFVRERFEGWNAPVDTSCAAIHQDPDDGSCYDHLHVLAHHTETPVFIAGSSSDPSHLDKPPVHLSVDTPSVCWATLIPGDPAAGADLYKARHRAQAVAYALNRDNPAGGAHGDSHSAGPIGVFVPDWPKHLMLPDDCRAGQMRLGTDPKTAMTLLEAISAWRAGTDVALVEGVAGVQLFDTKGCDADRLPRTCVFE